MNYKKGIFLLGLGLSMLFGKNANAQLSLSGNIINNVSCNGGTNGSASVILSGGTAPYTYSWSPSGGSGDTATGLSAGTYTVSVEDNVSNTGTVTVTVNQPNAVSASASTVTNVSCNGGINGSVTASISGGTSPFTYAWTGGATTGTATGLSAGTYTVTVTDSCGGTATASAIINQPNAVSATTSIIDNVTCNGGSTGAASASVSGGTSPFTYSWTNGGTDISATGLSAGAYTVTVTDSCGGTTSAVATITQPAVLSASTSVISVSCNGGSNGQASAVLTGGTSPYTYAWAGGATTNNITGLSAGSYSVTVQDICGGSATALATVTQPAVLGISPFTIANVSCNGASTGSASAGLTGGGAPFTYSWTSGATTDTATGLSAGSYSVTVQDACGGTATGTVTLTQPNAISISASVTANVSCHGSSTGSASSSMSGGTSPYTYAWTPSGGSNSSASGLSAGTYTVTITDSCGGSASASATITQPIALAITASVTGNVTCHGGSTGSASSVTSGGTSPYTYSWTPSGGSNSSASLLSAGSYTITVSDMCGASASAKATITQPAALALSANAADNVTCNGGDNGQAASNVSGGTLPYTYSWSNGETVAAATGLSAGTYTVTVEDFCGASLSTVTTISQPNPLSVTASLVANVACHGGNSGQASSTTAGGTSPFTYTWTNGATSALATGLTAGSYTISVQDNCGATATANVALTQPAGLAVVATTLINNSCNGGNAGSVSAAISGGTSSYAYSWAPSGGNNPVANGLLAGVYTVTVTDSCGSSVSASTIVTQPIALSVTGRMVNAVSCNGGDNGSGTSAASGGTAPYAYSWAPSGGTNSSAINLVAGIYTVTATDACGGVASTTINIAQPNPLSISTTVTSNNTCYGQYNGAATSQLSGGTKPYIYTWLPTGGHVASISNVAAGVYTVTVYDSCGSSATATATITEPAKLNITATTLSNIACFGDKTGSAVTSASGGVAPYAYFWSSGSSSTSVSGLPAGNYTVEVTDLNGCTNTAISVVTQPPAINVTTRVRNDNGIGSGAIWLSVSGGVTPYAYLWTPGGNMTDSITDVAAGNYCCTITDNNGCIDDVCATINSDAGVASLSSSAQHITVYPNPSTGMFTIQSSVSSGDMAIEVYNLIGEKVYSQSSIHNAQFTINLSNQPNGIYLYRVLSNDNGSLLGEGKVVLQK